jgi:beta-glucosidase
MGREAAARGIDILLAPNCNLARTPTAGRLFESFGEDPHLTARLTRGVVEGIQSAGVCAVAKHFVANNHETDRYTTDVRVSERTLRELYLPAFRAAVEAEVGAVMTAYNGVNGRPMSRHERLLRGVLRGEWDFSGVVLSDWWGVEESIEAARADLDTVKPGVSIGEFTSLPEAVVRGLRVLPNDPLSALPEQSSKESVGDRIARAVRSDALDPAVLDGIVRRVLRTAERFGDGRAGERSAGSGTLDGPTTFDPAEHRSLAREIAIRGTTLLVNDGALPIEEDATIALCGPNADQAKTGGGGSSRVTPAESRSPADGIAARSEGRDRFERGCEPIAESDPLAFASPSSSSRPATGSRSGRHTPDRAARLAAASEVAIVVVGDDASEGRDREDLSLPGAGNEVVERVAATDTPTIVVVRSSGPVSMPWLDRVDAVLVNWYPGEADGDALAAVLSGDEGPGGRLPVTFGAELEDYPAAPEPDSATGERREVRYEEGLRVGYRGFDANDREPLFPFGHGETYTSFVYRDCAPDGTDPIRLGQGVTLPVTIENSGSRGVFEVVQAYVERSDPSRPPRELVGFGTEFVPAGETETIDVPIDPRSVAVYDESGDGWDLPDEEVVLDVGRSSRDRRLRARLDVRS